jgi:hypothetical protein
MVMFGEHTRCFFDFVSVFFCYICGARSTGLPSRFVLSYHFLSKPIHCLIPLVPRPHYFFQKRIYLAAVITVVLVVVLASAAAKLLVLMIVKVVILGISKGLSVLVTVIVGAGLVTVTGGEGVIVVVKMEVEAGRVVL